MDPDQTDPIDYEASNIFVDDKKKRKKHFVIMCFKGYT